MIGCQRYKIRIALSVILILVCLEGVGYVEPILDTDESLGKDNCDGFDLDDFWKKACAVVGVMSHEATKLCLVFSEPPKPTAKECEPLIQGIEKAALACVSTMYSLPKAKGNTLRKLVRKGLLRIVVTLQTLLGTIRSNGFESTVSQLQQTGTVWEACEDFPKLPRDNHAAVCYVLRHEYQMIRDALQELQQAYEEFREEQEEDGVIGQEEEMDDEEEDEEENWKKDDEKYITASIGLLTAARACLKKAVPAVEKSASHDHLVELDSIGHSAEAISPAIDDLVTGVYPPIKDQLMAENVVIVENSLLSLLEQLKQSHVTGEDDQACVEFLIKAVHHNAAKIHQLTSS